MCSNVLVPPLSLNNNNNHFKVNTTRLDQGIYSVEYDNNNTNVKAGIRLRNNIQHSFNSDDSIVHYVIDVESVIDSSNVNLNIVNQGDILVNVNGIEVGKKSIIDLTNLIKRTLNNTTVLTFLKPNVVPLYVYNNSNSNNINNDDYKVINQSEEKILKCSRCKSSINIRWKFCNHCGNNLTLLPKKLKKAMDFIDKVDHEKYLNKSTYSSININHNIDDNNNNSKINEYSDSVYDYDDDKTTTLSIDKKVLNAIDKRINSFNTNDYKIYKKKMMLGSMLADELELQNAEFVESSYRQIVNDYKNNDDGETLIDFIV